MNKLIICLITILSSCYGKSPVVKTGLEGELLPKYDLLSSDSATHFNIRAASSDKPIVIFSFATWCPYCRAQTEEILDNILELKDINFYLTTTSPLNEVNKFYNHFKLGTFKNITIGFDYTYHFGNYFQTNAVPSFAIYGKDKRLKRVLIGKSSINLIKEIAFDN